MTQRAVKAGSEQARSNVPESVPMSQANDRANISVRLPKLPEPRRIQTYGYKTVPGYTAEQVEAIRREAVLACIAVCESVAWASGTANACVSSLRALLEDGNGQ